MSVLLVQEIKAAEYFLKKASANYAYETLMQSFKKHLNMLFRTHSNRPSKKTIWDYVGYFDKTYNRNRLYKLLTRKGILR